jgi:hypothetical protein
MKRAMIAATVYFLALFALGFVLGTFRVLLIAPRVGKFAATLAEVPVMLTAAYFACRWAVRRWQVPKDPLIRWAMVLWFLALLVLLETLLGTLLFGRTLADQWGALATPAGMMGLSAQVLAAVFPLFVGKTEADLPTPYQRFPCS